MSQVYSTEPQTSGLVVFETTHGPLSIHLWCKECPTTCRYFLQLCLDGFYDNLIFHRIVPNFLIQTGDASFRQNTKDASQRQPPSDKYRNQHQASQAMERRQYELNSRIRFNHRGQVAMALGVNDDDGTDDESLRQLQPQFFITLDEASHLDGKHVCFGGIHGPTMFNALRIGQMDVNEENYQPRIIEEAPRVLKVKIQQVDSPPTLPTLAPTPEPPLLPWRIDPSAGGAVSKLKKKKRKAVKNVNLLSFGEEMNEEEVGGAAGGKIQSSHDVLAKEGGGGGKSRFVNQIDEELEQRLQKDDVGKQKQKSSRKTIKTSQEDQPKIYDQDEAKQSNTQTTVEQIQVLPELSNPTFVSRKNALPPAAEEKKDETKAEAPKVPKPKKMSLVEARRAKYAKQASSKKKGDKQKREEETMAKFMNFQKKIIQEKANSSTSAADHSHGYHGQVTEGDIEHGNSDWIKTTFKCKRHMDHDASKGGDGRAADDYKVIEERNAPTDRKHDRKKRRH